MNNRGLYDWILNSLNVDESPATHQLPTPFANSVTPSLPNSGGNPNPMATMLGGGGMMGGGNDDNLKQTMIQKYLQSMTQNGKSGATGMGALTGMGGMMSSMAGMGGGDEANKPMTPTAPVFVGTPRQPQAPMPPAFTPKMKYLMQAMAGNMGSN